MRYFKKIEIGYERIVLYWQTIDYKKTPKPDPVSYLHFGLLYGYCISERRLNIGAHECRCRKIILLQPARFLFINGKDPLRNIEPKSNPMDGFQVYLGIRFEVLPEFGNEYVHASSQEVIVLSPYIEQDLLPF